MVGLHDTHKWLDIPCETLIRAKMVPDRAGADTQVIAHVPLSALRHMPVCISVRAVPAASKLV